MQLKASLSLHYIANRSLTFLADVVILEVALSQRAIDEECFGECLRAPWTHAVPQQTAKTAEANAHRGQPSSKDELGAVGAKSIRP